MSKVAYYQKHIIQTHSSKESVICDECRREPMSFDYPAVKPVVWSGNIWIRNERISKRGLCRLRSLDLLPGMEMKIAE